MQPTPTPTPIEILKTYRVEIRNRERLAATDRITETAQQLGIKSLRACTTTRLFFLGGELTNRDVDRIARELLCDPVTERYIIGTTDAPTEAQLVEVTPLPGVTDPIAENLVQAVARMGLAGLERAATGTRYELIGDLTPNDLDRLATQVLSNPLIQRHTIGEPIDAPFIAVREADDTVEVIAVRDLDDTGLLALSTERRLSLDTNEMRAIRDYYAEIERDPTDAELEMLAQTWSEHCVHKTFKANITYTGPAHGAAPDSPTVTQQIDGILNTYLRAATDKLNKPWVRSAFVDNAGIIAFDDDFDIAFKVETHNRPSALEPFGGANTGLGGVIRDVLGVSARPIANTDMLCFGPPDIAPEDLPSGVLHPQRVADGVVHGIEDYGNKMGIPTVNGAIVYHKGYISNPLVFCGCLGILPRGSHPTAAQPGDAIVVIGGRTGRDGLRGATFSSMEMDTQSATLSGGAVQIGHPIHEKQVQEVVLRARDETLYHAITDCGAGGLSSAVGEMGERIGATVQLKDVPLKYAGLRPWEIWLSEAQERMVLAVPQENLPRLQAICDGQNIDMSVIGSFEPTGQLTLRYGDKVVGDLSMTFLHDGIPQRQMIAEWTPPAQVELSSLPDNENYTDTLLKLLAMPTIRSKEDVIRRYDHEVGTGTAVKPLVGRGDHGPSDAAVVVPLDTLMPLTPQPPLPLRSGERGERGLDAIEHEHNLEAAQRDRRKLVVSPELHKRMIQIARRLRQEATASENILWEKLRGRQLDGVKIRRQQPIGAFVLDFYCPTERLAIEVDGAIHETQRDADAERQALLESLGIRFVRVSAQQVEDDVNSVLALIRSSITQAKTPPLPAAKQQWERGSGGEGATRAIALSNGLCPLYTEHDPYAMAWAAVDEAIRNCVAVGADPDTIAILDNFSWGNTQLPDRLGALVRCAQGCYDAAMAYGVPFISGKDSLNNEYLGADGQRHAIPGTLVISAVGIVPDVEQTVTMDLKESDNHLFIIGETRSELGGSHYNLLHGRDGGSVPQPVTGAIDVYRRLHRAIRVGLVQSCHDISEGGAAVALAEMAIAGRMGVTVKLRYPDGDPVAALFAESSGRLIVEVRDEDRDDFEDIMGDETLSFIHLTTDTSQFTITSAGQTLVDTTVPTLETAWRGQPQAQEPVERPDIPPADLRRETIETRSVTARLGKPKILILHANGTNRDRDAVLACELAGGDPEIVHVNQIVNGERDLLDYHMLVIPGGFSYGDDLGAGVLWALDLRERLTGLERFVDDGRPVLGICNGFQTLVKAGLIPGAEWTSGETGEATFRQFSTANGSDRSVTLTYNERGRFECRWIYLKPNPYSGCLFTDELTDLIHCPVAHGEGRVAVRDEGTLVRLWVDGLAALTYVDADGEPAGYPYNPNGSAYNIAGLCNPAGNVFGLMPHPENHIYPWQHPRFRRGQHGMSGLRLFENGIRFA